MSGMNMGRVVVGGIAAGLVINVVEGVMNFAVLGDFMTDLYERMGAAPPGGGAIAGYVMLAFLLGFLLAWLYAAIRPRFGAGPGTAVLAGVAVWVGASVVPVVGWYLMGVLAPGLLFLFLGYMLLELVLGALVAGIIYREPGQVT